MITLIDVKSDQSGAALIPTLLGTLALAAMIVAYLGALAAQMRTGKGIVLILIVGLASAIAARWTRDTTA